jgi:Ran GTPase-activating protein (RanGAP) involved in mRNA processing and transport
LHALENAIPRGKHRAIIPYLLLSILPMGCTASCCRRICFGAEPLLDAAAVLQALRDPHTTSIIANGKSLRDDHMVEIAAALRDNSKVITMWLGDNLFGEAGVTSLAAAVRGNRTLSTLDLWKNDIGDVEAAILAEALQENRTLTSLSLRGNSVGDTGARALAAALQHNTTMKILDLSDNQIGKAGETALRTAKANQQKSGLATLVLLDQRVGTAVTRL